MLSSTPTNKEVAVMGILANVRPAGHLVAQVERAVGAIPWRCHVAALGAVPAPAAPRQVGLAPPKHEQGVYLCHIPLTLGTALLPCLQSLCCSILAHACCSTRCHLAAELCPSCEQRSQKGDGRRQQRTEIAVKSKQAIPKQRPQVLGGC